MKYLTPFVAKLLVVAATVAASSSASSSVVLVTTSDAGFYNSSIGNTLNNTNGGDTSAGYFPTTDDSSVVFTTAPDLTAAAPVLGNWLANPASLNSYWHTVKPITNSWDVGTETAVIYKFSTLGATNVIASFGVDNGIFVWLDGNYVGGARDPGAAIPGEYSYNLGDLTSGTHYLQLLLEDHGVTNGYDVNVTADTFTPGPNPIPEPDSLALLGLGLAGIGYRMKMLKKSKSA